MLILASSLNGPEYQEGISFLENVYARWMLNTGRRLITIAELISTSCSGERKAKFLTVLTSSESNSALDTQAQCHKTLSKHNFHKHE